MSATVISISTGNKANPALHALTHESPVLPSEAPEKFEAFRAAVLDRFAPQAPEDVAAVLDYIDATWRLRRIALHEAELIALEVKRMRDDPALAQILPTLTPTAAEALAVERLFASKALVNLHRLEERLSRRLARVKPILDFLADVRMNASFSAAKRPFQPKSAQQKIKPLFAKSSISAAINSAPAAPARN